jgi:hypothetical protein
MLADGVCGSVQALLLSLDQHLYNRLAQNAVQLGGVPGRVEK